MKIIWAFLKRDFFLFFGSRFSILFNFFIVLTYAGTFYFIGHLFEGKMVDDLKPFGGDYFSYVLIGITLSNFISGSLGNLSNSIRQEQLMGTLEAVLSSPAPSGLILFSMTLWHFLSAMIDMLLYILAGIFIFHVSFGRIHWPSFLTVLVLTLITFTSLGQITASITLFFKGGNNFAGTLNLLFDFLGGVYFPVSLLPFWLKTIAYCLPVTYAIQAANKAIYKNASLLDLKVEVTILSLFAVVLLFLSLACFRFALKKAKQYGNLTHY